MKIVIVIGSTRKESQSQKVARRVDEKLLGFGAHPYILDLSKANLPVYDDTPKKEWEDVLSQIADADGYVLVVPEWNGSAAPGIVNFLTYTSVGGTKPLAHKPVLIASVSSGAGGAYPIAEIKAFHNKNNMPVFVPEHLRFRDVKNIFNSQEPEQNNEADKAMHDRTKYALKILLAYAEKLTEVRQLGIIDLDTYKHGS